MENLLQEMRSAVNEGRAQILTVNLAKSLKGKKIATIYFGYAGQDGADEFIVGDIVSEYDIHPDKNYLNQAFKNRPDFIKNMKDTLCLLNDKGSDTSIRCHKFNNGEFTCSDSDRFVSFIER